MWQNSVNVQSTSDKFHKPSLKKVSLLTNIAKNFTGGREIFYFPVLFSDISFVKNDRGKDRLVV